jgi:hypothetical protein
MTDKKGKRNWRRPSGRTGRKGKEEWSTHAGMISRQERKGGMGVDVLE